MNQDSPFERGQIGGRTLTLKNLRAIDEAMSRIESIDQSEAFRLYQNEVCQRIGRLEQDARQEAARNAGRI